MAYGNWGAFVYRNGERMHEWEDQTPYEEHRLTPGYHQAFGVVHEAGQPVESITIDRGRDRISVHHAVLGQQRVRLCGYKNYPIMFLDRERVELDPYLVGGEPFDNAEYKGEIEGCEFTAEQDGNMLSLYLKEPDGTVWTSTCGYEHGAGHQD